MRVWGRCLIAICVLLACVLSVVGLQCDSCETCNGNISVTNGGTIYLTSDITATGDCINLINNVIFDCNDSTITGPLRNSSFYSKSFGQGYNTTLQNCEISNFKYGYEFKYAENITIRNVTIRNSSASAVDISYTQNITIEKVKAVEGNIGFDLDFVGNMTIRNCTTSNNSNYGFTVSFSRNSSITNITSTNESTAFSTMFNNHVTLANISITKFRWQQGFNILKSADRDNIITNVSINQKPILIIDNYNYLCPEGMTLKLNDTYSFIGIFQCNGLIIDGISTNDGLMIYDVNNSRFRNINVTDSSMAIETWSCINLTFTHINTSFNEGAGFFFDETYNSTFANIEASHNDWTGFYLGWTSGPVYHRLENVTANGNAEAGLEIFSTGSFYSNITCARNVEEGIYISDAYNNTFSGLRLFNNSNGLYLDGPVYGNVFNDSYFLENNHSAIYFDTSSDLVENNTFYNNIINSSNHVNITSTPYTNYWNTSENCAQINIIGGSCMGGNFWTSPTGNNYSDTCTNYLAPTSFCDSVYTFLGNNTDYLALDISADPVPIQCDSCSTCNTVIQTASIGDTITLLNGFTGTGDCISLKSGINLDCNGSTLTGMRNGRAISNISGIVNVEISNCKVINFTVGLEIRNSENVTVRNFTAINYTLNAVGLNVTNNVTLDRIWAARGNNGIMTFRTENFTVMNSSASGMGNIGFYFLNSTNGTIFNLTSYNNNWSINMHNTSFSTMDNVSITIFHDQRGFEYTADPGRGSVFTDVLINQVPVLLIDRFNYQCPDNLVLSLNDSYSYVGVDGCVNLTIDGAIVPDGFAISRVNRSTFTNINCTGEGRGNGMYIKWARNSTFSSINSSFNRGSGLAIEKSYLNTFTNIELGYNNGTGLWYFKDLENGSNSFTHVRSFRNIPYGLRIHTDGNRFRNVTAAYSTMFGVYIDNSSYGHYSEMNVFGNYYGVYLFGVALENVINDSHIWGNTNATVYFNSGVGNVVNNTFYNNIFNGTLHVDGEGAANDNYFNTTQDCTRINIMGESCIGGNYWTSLSGNYSDSCANSVGEESFCDASHTPFTGNIDYLPLTLPQPDTTAPTITLISPSNTNVSRLQVRVNISISETGMIWYSIDNVRNRTICSTCTNGSKLANLTYYGNHTLRVYANDTSGNMNSTVRNFTILLDTDGDGLIDADDTDDDGDGVMDGLDNLNGNLSNVISNVPGLNLTINGSSNLSMRYNTSITINFTNGTETLITFDYDFSLNQTINFGNITITKQENGSAGSIIVSGLTLTTGQTKTVFIDDVDGSKGSVCVKDAEITSITEISTGCNGAGEVRVDCPGSASGFSCVDLGARYRITGLTHSGVVETTTVIVPPPDDTPRSSGGSGGGYIPRCNANWTCSNWGSCKADGTQVRVCIDYNNCSTTGPNTTQACSYTAPVEDAPSESGNDSMTDTENKPNNENLEVTGEAVVDPEDDWETITEMSPLKKTFIIALIVLIVMAIIVITIFAYRERPIEYTDFNDK